MTDQARAEALLLGDVRDFLDVEVRAMLPNEHTNCAIDSGCAHGAMERDNFDTLDRMVTRLAAALQARQPEGGA